MNEKMSFHKYSNKLSKFKSALFNISYLILRERNQTPIKEILFTSIEFFQLLSFPFHLKFSLYWKQPSTFNQISFFLQFTHLTPFFQSTFFFYFSFYFVIVIVIIYNSLFTFVLILYHKNKFNHYFLLKIIKKLSLYLSTILYIPFMCFFLSPFNCSKKESFIDCKGIFNYFNAIIGCLFAVVLTIDAILIKLTLFEIKNTAELDANIGKSTGTFDFLMIVVKSILLISFIIFDNYLLVIICCLMAWLFYYSYNSIQPHYNIYITNCFRIWIFIFIYANFLVLIGNLLVDSQYDGNIPLFSIGIAIIIAGSSISITDKLSKVLVDMNNFTQGKDAVRFINDLWQIIKEIELKDRRAKIFIQGYINHYETLCKDPNCALKKYNSCINNGDLKKRNFFLYKHIDQIYQYSISKYRKCNRLRISYAIFLIQYMKKKKNSMREFAIVENSMPSFEEDFIIFRYKKYLDSDSIYIPNSHEDNNDKDGVNNDTSLSQNFNYFLFKKALKKISAIYIDFWTLLSSKNQDINGLETLSELGTKIAAKIKEIDGLFKEIAKVNNKEPDLFFIYSEYLDNLLNKADKADQFRKTYIKVLELKEETIGDTPNFEDNTLISSNDESQYIIISSSESSMGSIINVSLSLCALFGYLKNELINQPIELLLPELYRTQHQQILSNSLIEYKQTLLQSDALISKPQFVLHECFAKTKSKYLTPVVFQTAFVFTEKNGILIIAQFNQLDNMKQNECCVMTNNSLFIDSFTPNSIGGLNLNSSQMRNGVDITKYIKQFYEQFLRLALENDCSTLEDKLALKSLIINKYYDTPRDITWKQIEGNCQESKKFKSKDSIDSKNKSQIGLGVYKEIYCTVNVEKLMINNYRVGYLFRFENNSEKASSYKGNMSLKLKGKAGNGKSNSNSDNNSNLTIALPSPRRVSKATTHNNNLTNEYMSYIKDGNYIPLNSKSFQIDLKSRSYKANALNQQTLKDEIRQLVSEKIKKIRAISLKPNESSSDDLDNDSNNSSDSDINDKSNSNTNSNSSNCVDSDRDSSNLSTSQKGKMVMNTIKDNVDNIQKNTDTYYKVNLNPIKYLQYNYKKSIFESLSFVKRSQVEIRKGNEKEEESKISQLNSNKKSDQNVSHATNDPNNLNDISKTKESKDSLSFLSKKIEYALLKEETQPTITRLKFFSLLSFVFLIVYLVIWFSLLINSYFNLRLNFLNIKYALEIMINNACAYTKVKELTLLYQDKYVKYLHENKTEDIILLCNELDIIAQNNSNIINTLITSEEDFLPQGSLKILKASNVTMSIIKIGSKEKINYDIGLLTALSQGNSELIIIASNVKQYLLRDSNVFFFINNALNGIQLALETILKFFNSGFELNTHSTIIICIIILILGIPSVIVLCLMVTISYTAVSRRKDNYLEVFFKIHASTIKALLVKCEKFHLQIQTDSVTEFISLSDNLNDSFDDKFLLGMSKGGKSHNLDYPDKFDNTKSNMIANHHHKIKEKVSEMIKSSLNNTNTKSKEMRIIKIKIMIAFIIQLLFFVTLFIICYINLTSLNKYIASFSTQTNLYFRFIFLFVNYRELITQTYNYIGINKENEEDFNSFLINFYRSLQSNSQILLPPTYIPYYGRVFSRSLCDIPELSLPEEKDFNCSTIFYSTPLSGLGVLGMALYDQIILLKSINDFYINLRKTYNFRYNLTVEGTSDEKDYLPDDESQMENYRHLHPINELNTIHYFELNEAYTYFLEPGIKLLFHQLSDCIGLIFDKIQALFFILIGGFGLFNILGYFLLWKPFEYNLNSILFKTKNLLSIVPSHVLGMMNSAKVLLGIDYVDSNTNNNQQKDKK